MNEGVGTQGAAEDMTESMRHAMSLDGDRSRLASFYDVSAATYDADVADHGYGLPSEMVTTLAEAVARLDDEGFAPPSPAVLDAGCGTRPQPDHLAGRFDIVTVGGVFTVGHLPPDTLTTIAPLARPGGLLVVSTRQAYRGAPTSTPPSPAWPPKAGST